MATRARVWILAGGVWFLILALTPQTLMMFQPTPYRWAFGVPRSPFLPLAVAGGVAVARGIAERGEIRKISMALGVSGVFLAALCGTWIASERGWAMWGDMVSWGVLPRLAFAWPVLLAYRAGRMDLYWIGWVVFVIGSLLVGPLRSPGSESGWDFAWSVLQAWLWATTAVIVAGGSLVIACGRALKDEGSGEARANPNALLPVEEKGSE